MAVALAKTVVVSVPLGAVDLLANVDFNNTITTGALLSSLLVVVIAGLFTIRANAAKTWKDNYEGEKVHREETEAELRTALDLIVSERDTQQTLRHELKNEIAALQMKTDLTAHEAQEIQRHGEVMTAFSHINDSLREVAVSLRSQNGHGV